MATQNLVPELTVFFPAYNEEKNIQICLDTALTVLPQFAKKWEILVIVSAWSTDNTISLVEEYQKKHPSIHLIIQPKEKKGVGAAYLLGFEHARYSLIFYCDSDNQFNLSELGVFLSHAANYDIIAGQRIHRKDPFMRIFTSKIYNFFLRLLFHTSIKDLDCAFRLVHKRVFDKITITSKTGLMTAELIIKAQRLGYRVLQLPVTHYPRTAGQTRFGIPGIDLPKPKVILEIVSEIRNLFKDIHK